MRENEHELAVFLDRAIDPADPQFDLPFAVEIMRIRPDWFTKEERQKVIEAVKIGLKSDD